MKTSKILFGLLVSFASLLTSSCSKDDEHPIDPVSKDDHQLSKIYIDNELSSEFTYNNQNQLVKVVYPGDDVDEVVFEYNSRGLVVKEIEKNGSQVSTRSYEYNSQSLASKITTTGNQFSNGYDELFYNADKTLKELKSFRENGSDVKETFDYNVSGNMVDYKWYYDDILSAQTHSVLTYDNKKNPFKGLVPYHYYSDLELLLLSPNNITKITTTDDDGDIYIQSFAYKYNDSGYPTEMVFSEDGDSETWRFEYKNQ